MATPSAQPLLLAIGYGAILSRVIRRGTIVFFDPDVVQPKPPARMLFVRTVIGFIAVGIVVTIYYLMKYSLGTINQGIGPVLQVLFESIPPIVGIILLVVAVLDHILEKEGFVT